jgi:hypothetical protein
VSFFKISCESQNAKSCVAEFIIIKLAFRRILQLRIPKISGGG